MVLRPRPIVVLTILQAFAFPLMVQGFFVPLKLEEKVAQAEVIFIGKVVRITKVMMQAETKDDDGESFWGVPTEMAVVKIETS